jgi:thiamine-phosphate pyrophosphorylase
LTFKDLIEYFANVDTKIIRLIDANANRAREGLRVLEEIARMLWDEAELTGQLKAKRHQVSKLINKLPLKTTDLLQARDSADDVGSTASLKSENKRGKINDLVISNFKRVEESLRVLEEFTKLLDAAIAEKFKKMRFEIYTLEKEMGTHK